jgi:hypothetical protein
LLSGCWGQKNLTFFFQKIGHFWSNFAKKKVILVVDFEWGGEKIEKKTKKKKTFLKSKNAFSSLFVLAISRVWPFCLLKNSNLARKNKI